MPSLGILECNRCRIMKIQDDAAKNKMQVTLRKSLYGPNPKKPGVDVYVHPRSMEIPSHYKYAHGQDFASQQFLAELWDDDDPEKWFAAWFPGIPPKCVCKVV